MSETKSISHCQGKGSISHNNRDFISNNVDSSRTNDNVTFIKQPITEAYEECFGAAVQRYNASQSRADRKINESYYESVFNHAPCNTVLTSSDKRKSFYEDVVQIGTMNDTGCGTADGKLAVECLTEYMQGFSKRNPNMHVFNAVLHQDEATPHLHIDYIPIGHYKRGIDTQNGIAQALKEMGYGNGKGAISRWRETERKILEDICKARGIEISEPKESRGSLSVEEYKEYAKLHEQKNALKGDVQALQATKDKLNEILHTEPQNVINGTPTLLSKDKRTISVSDLNSLNELAKAVSVRDKEQQAISKQQEQLRDELNTKAEELKEKENILNNREYEIERKEAKTEKNYQEMQKEPYISKLEERIKELKNTCKELAKDCNDENNDHIKTRKRLQETQNKINPIENENRALLERIKVLEEDNQQKTQEIIEKEDLIKELDKKQQLHYKWYSAACEIGERLDDDFDKKVDKRLDGYSVKYIFGDDRNKTR